MTHDELTALWREAGRPIVDGLQMGNGDVVSSAAGHELATPSGLIEPGLLGSHEPDWDHPMTEFALMCAAEQAAGYPLVWYHGLLVCDRMQGWDALRVWADGDPEPGGDAWFHVNSETRIECALRVIIACREAE